jgi:hypothetical protein
MDKSMKELEEKMTLETLISKFMVRFPSRLSGIIKDRILSLRALDHNQNVITHCQIGSRVAMALDFGYSIIPFSEANIPTYINFQFDKTEVEFYRSLYETIEYMCLKYDPEIINVILQEHEDDIHFGYGVLCDNCNSDSISL